MRLSVYGVAVQTVVSEYTKAHNLPPIQMKAEWTDPNTVYGVIPHYLDEDQVIHPKFVTRDFDSCFLGSSMVRTKDYFIRESSKAISYYNENSKKGIIVHKSKFNLREREI